MVNFLAIRVPCLLSLAMLIPMGVGAQTRSDVDASRRAVQEALDAQGRGDEEGVVKWLTEALVLRPGHPDLHFRLAGALARAGLPEQAIRHLEIVQEMGMAYDPSRDPAFANLTGDARYHEVVEGLLQNGEPSGQARDLGVVPVEPDFIPEGLAYDPVGSRYYLGSVRKRTILSFRPGEEPVIVAPPGFQGLASAMGMVVDPVRRHLWVCSTGLPQTEGLDPEQEGRSAIFRFDLDSGELIVTYHFPPRDERRRAIGDIEIDEEGRIYLSDGAGSGVYTIRPGGDFIETLIQPGTFVSPQGIAAPPGDRYFYVADYSRGIFRVHRDTRRVEALLAPPGATVLGIDELAWHPSGLVAVQNGTYPQRILRLPLTSGGIGEVEVLASNLEAWQEPSLGTVIGDRFYFVATSQWNRFDGPDLPPVDQLEPPRIQWVDLGSGGQVP